MTGFVIPELRSEPVIVTPSTVENGGGRTLLLVVAHADDPALFLGGTIALWADAGWRIVCLRATDDRWDSLGLDEGETVRRNAQEYRAAATVLGISDVEDLGFQTDVLGDVSRVALRERIIKAIRRHRPYGLVTFDPDSLFFEDNLDHRVLAQAVAEAAWCAMFDKHHPEHFADGFAPHGVVARWYFGRTVPAVTHVLDISTTLDRQIEAALAHGTMIANIVRQFTLQTETAGRRPTPLLAAAQAGAHRPLVERWLRGTASTRGAPFGLAAADWLRLHRTDAGWL